jgi:hypothetical protein
MLSTPKEKAALVEFNRLRGTKIVQHFEEERQRLVERLILERDAEEKLRLQIAIQVIDSILKVIEESRNVLHFDEKRDKGKAFRI